MFQKISIYTLVTVALSGGVMSCSSDSDSAPDAASKEGLAFSAGEVLSRSTLVTSDNITNNSFSVYGDVVVNDSPSSTTPVVVFEGTKVAYEAGAWKYDNLQYWVPGNTYSFVALSPSTCPEVSDISYTKSQLSFSYTYPQDDYKKATDLLVSTHRRKYAFGQGQSTVAFKFHHALSRLDFVANIDPATPEGTAVTINSISLRNVGTNASFSITPAPIASGAAIGTSTDDIAGLVGNLWSVPTQPGTLFTYSDDETLEIGGKTSHRYFPAESNALMVIPQRLEENVEVVVTYTITVDEDKQPSKTLTSRLYSIAVNAHDGVWLPGKSYTYNFTLGANDLIIFATPTVQDWEDNEGGNYII